MRTAALKRSAPHVHVRAGAIGDLDVLVALEQSVFAADCMARKNLQRFLSVATAEVLIADCDGDAVGCAIVSFRATNHLARLYSLAVARAAEGSGVAAILLDAAEAAARSRNCAQIRLEVHENNARAIACYRKAGYQEFGRHVGYYKDLGDALRFRKELA
jgi:[ribosomal protein S18]-alanine N-acetyltransferase